MDRHTKEEQDKAISDQEILWKILHSVEKIDATLIGTAYTNNKGLVHKVEEHGVAIEGIDKRLREVELGAKTEEKLEKKSNSFWGVAASVAAAIVSIIALLFSFKK
jgi:hypothetical protein